MNETTTTTAGQNARIAELTSADCHGERTGTDGCDSSGLCPTCYGEAEEELARLRSGTSARTVTEILADLAAPSTEIAAEMITADELDLYRELEDAVRTRLAPLPEGEAERLAEQAERTARTVPPPVPGVTRHNGYIFQAVIHMHDREPGLLAAWLVAGGDERGHWVTWNAYDQDGRLTYEAGHYFDGPDAKDNRRRAMADLAIRAGTMSRVGQHIANDVLSWSHAPAEDRRMARRLRKWCGA